MDIHWAVNQKATSLMEMSLINHSMDRMDSFILKSFGHTTIMRYNLYLIYKVLSRQPRTTNVYEDSFMALTSWRFKNFRNKVSETVLYHDWRSICHGEYQHRFVPCSSWTLHDAHLLMVQHSQSRWKSCWSLAIHFIMWSKEMRFM